MASVFKRGGKGNRGGHYYIAWFDHTSKRRTKSSKTSDKATAERIASKLEADAALRREGVIDAQLDAMGEESRRTVESHLTDYEAKLRAANRSDGHVNRTMGFIDTICKAADFATGADVTADGVNRYASELQTQGKSARTIQARLTAIKSFTKWLAENQKLPRDPLSSVRKPNPKANRRRERRFLLHEEWSWLRATTEAGTDGMCQ